ncbi:MAG: hypothetical protein U1F68_03050 [Gammaproteobacteria bacterium]
MRTPRSSAGPGLRERPNTADPVDARIEPASAMRAASQRRAFEVGDR